MNIMQKDKSVPFYLGFYKKRTTKDVSSGNKRDDSKNCLTTLKNLDFGVMRQKNRLSLNLLSAQSPPKPLDLIVNRTQKHSYRNLAESDLNSSIFCSAQINRRSSSRVSEFLNQNVKMENSSTRISTSVSRLMTENQNINNHFLKESIISSRLSIRKPVDVFRNHQSEINNLKLLNSSQSLGYSLLSAKERSLKNCEVSIIDEPASQSILRRDSLILDQSPRIVIDSKRKLLQSEIKVDITYLKVTKGVRRIQKIMETRILKECIVELGTVRNRAINHIKLKKAFQSSRNRTMMNVWSELVKLKDLVVAIERIQTFFSRKSKNKKSKIFEELLLVTVKANGIALINDIFVRNSKSFLGKLKSNVLYSKIFDLESKVAEIALTFDTKLKRLSFKSSQQIIGTTRLVKFLEIIIPSKKELMTKAFYLMSDRFKILPILKLYFLKKQKIETAVVKMTLQKLRLFARFQSGGRSTRISE